MTNQPLSSNEHAKILIFSLLMLPAIFFGVGIIPAIFLLFGIFMMKKDKSFSSIDTAVKLFKGYTWLWFVGCAIFMLYWGEQYLIGGKGDEHFAGGVFFTGLAYAYLIFVQKLFYNPLKNHAHWVETNGIFSTKNKVVSKEAIQQEVDIIKGEKLTQYSVADELTKWAKLKEDGHISETEFNDARAKLLERS